MKEYKYKHNGKIYELYTYEVEVRLRFPITLEDFRKSKVTLMETKRGQEICIKARVGEVNRAGEIISIVETWANKSKYRRWKKKKI